jgi:ubiquinone/menaquinone biosynthesis C-methylase UbiE
VIEFGDVMPANIDRATVEGFGHEWAAFTQSSLSDSERSEMFEKYFRLIDWNVRPKRALDMGCGSGRWSVLVAPRVDSLVLADASPQALNVARANVKSENVSFVECTPETIPYADGTFDFIFSIGVLHHVPDTAEALRSLARKLSPGGTLLVYLYYAFDNRPLWYWLLWKATDILRRVLSKSPFIIRRVLAEAIAAAVYWPLARAAKYLPVPSSWPLKFYADRSFYTMRTDALDRFGTRIERRFTKEQISSMMQEAGLGEVRFSSSDPYWVCTAVKPH